MRRSARPFHFTRTSSLFSASKQISDAAAMILAYNITPEMATSMLTQPVIYLKGVWKGHDRPRTKWGKQARWRDERRYRQKILSPTAGSNDEAHFEATIKWKSDWGRRPYFFFISLPYFGVNAIHESPHAWSGPFASKLQMIMRPCRYEHSTAYTTDAGGRVYLAWHFSATDDWWSPRNHQAEIAAWRNENRRWQASMRPCAVLLSMKIARWRLDVYEMSMLRFTYRLSHMTPIIRHLKWRGALLHFI